MKEQEKAKFCSTDVIVTFAMVCRAPLSKLENLKIEVEKTGTIVFQKTVVGNLFITEQNPRADDAFKLNVAEAQP